jgi:hypothetical protein
LRDSAFGKTVEALMVHVRSGKLTARLLNTTAFAVPAAGPGPHVDFLSFCDYRHYREIGADRLTRLLPVSRPRSAA